MSNEIPLLMPKMSMTMTEGELTTWHKQVGDTIRAGEVVCEVMTDKVDMEVESPVDGVLSKIIIQAGEVLPVGEPIAYITSEADDLLGDLLAPASAAPPNTSPQNSSVTTDASTATVVTEVPSAAPVANAGIPAAVPRARGMAKAAGLDLATVHGSGSNGLITVADVERALGSTKQPVASRPTPAVTTVVAAPAPSAPALGDAKKRATVRERVGALMSQSAVIPQFTAWRDINLEHVAAARKGVSWNTIIFRALSQTLRNMPELNGTWTTQFNSAENVAVGLAIDSSIGLLAPTITDADLVDIEELDAELRALVARAKSGKIEARYLAPASSALSNLGSLGVERFNAMLTPPHITALSVGFVGRKPVAHEGGIALHMTATVGLTVDHRALDGADAARALGELARVLSSAELLGL